MSPSRPTALEGVADVDVVRLTIGRELVGQVVVPRLPTPVLVVDGQSYIKDAPCPQRDPELPVATARYTDWLGKAAVCSLSSHI